MQTNEVPREYAFFGSAQFDDPVRAAGRKAFSETLAAALPGASSGENYEVIRELTAHAA